MKTKKIIACILASCTMLGSLSMQGVMTGTADGADDGAMRDSMTAQQYADDMGLGINLGNTMEGYWLDLNRTTSGASTAPGKTPQNFETCWGAVVTTQEIINGMRDAGFKTVRIPVYWGNMMTEDGTYTINSEYIGRVKEIVDYCRNAGLYAVINMHHYDEFVIRHYITFGTLEGCAETIKHLWTQIANYFKDYSDYLMFEGFNEYLGGAPYKLDSNGNILKDADGNAQIADAIPAEKAYEWTNTLNQAFVDAVRATGGNNAERMLIASGYFTNIDNTTSDKFIMPTDSVKDRLMVSVHYVDNSIYWQNTIGNDNWRKYSIIQLERLKSAFTAKGIPVFIGETTASYDGHFASDADVTDSSEALDYMLRLIKSYNFVPVIWDVRNIDPKTQQDISFYSRTTYKVQIESNAKVIYQLSKELADGTFVPLKTEDFYVPPMSKEDALGLIYSGKGPVVLASGTADAAMAGATSIRYIFDSAPDTSLNPWATINLSATVGEQTSTGYKVGEDQMLGQTELKAVLELTAPIKEGDSYSVSASTEAWGDASDYVFLIRCIEFLDADGNVIKTIDKSNKPEEPVTQPTSNDQKTDPTSGDQKTDPTSGDQKIDPSKDSSTIPTVKAPTTAAPNLTTAPKTTSKAQAKKAMKQAKIKKLTVKSKGKKITVKWKKVSKANGYQVQVSANKKFKKIIVNKKSVKKTNITIKSKKLKKGKTYYIRVRAFANYGKSGKANSDWKKLGKVKFK